jgi:16S rRNA (cytidine1402-2'-O)-methyltransferase
MPDRRGMALDRHDPLRRATIEHVKGSGTLYLVGTPIGNLGDMTDRARETLAAVDVVAAEDTRRTGRLLAQFGIEARLTSMFEGNERARTDELLTVLRDGRDVAVVSDAGMPGLSDPGFRLVRACTQEDIPVHVVPGPSAAVAALVVSGLPTDRFVFEGFLPRRAGERRSRLRALLTEPRTMVLFESPRRVRATLREVAAVLGDRRVALVRELTKLHEEVVRGRASDVLEQIGARDPRGEVVLVIEGAGRQTDADLDAATEDAQAAISRGIKPRAAAAEAAGRHGVAANDVYRALVSRRRALDPTT